MRKVTVQQKTQLVAVGGCMQEERKIIIIT